jgi:hypothetical protein
MLAQPKYEQVTSRAMVSQIPAALFDETKPAAPMRVCRFRAN